MPIRRIKRNGLSTQPRTHKGFFRIKGIIQISNTKILVEAFCLALELATSSRGEIYLAVVKYGNVHQGMVTYSARIIIAEPAGFDGFIQ